MEKIYNPDDFECTEPLDLKSFFRNYQIVAREKKNKSLIEEESILNMARNTFGLTEFSMKDMKNMEKLVSGDKLRGHFENNHLPYKAISKNEPPHHVHPFIAEARHLESAKFKETFNLKTHENVYHDDFGIQFQFEDVKDQYVDLDPGLEYIIKIIVYVPLNTLIPKKLCASNLRLLYEIEVLGSSTLTDFLKEIDCISDKFSSEEVPNLDVDLTSMTRPMDEYPSRTLFIENTFYNDMRHPNAIDYSEFPRKWAMEKDIGVLRAENIENVRFNQLKLRLGYGYVYIHQGFCEHVICINDARLLVNKDSLCSSNYPRKTAVKRRGSFLCFICSVTEACWLVLNSDRLPMRKVFFCTKCCRSYMFLDGKKLGKFQLFSYFNEVDAKAGLTNRPECGNNDLKRQMIEDSDDEDIKIDTKKFRE